MIIRDMDFVLTLSEPWIARCGMEYEEVYRRILSLQSINPGMRVIILDGQSMTTMQSYYDELTKKLELPDYFGRNTDALDECITDLEWIDFDAIVLLIKDSDKVLDNESNDKLKTFLDVLWDAGAEWSHSVTLNMREKCEPHPFHTILVQKDMNTILRCGFQHDVPSLFMLQDNYPEA